MRAVNLLPVGQRRRRGINLPKPVVAGLAVLALGSGLGMWAHSLSSSTSAAERDLTTALAEQAQVQGQLGSYRVAQQRAASLASERDAIQALTSARVDWERLIRTVATVLPPQVWLTSLRAQTPGSTATTTGSPAPGSATADGAAIGLHLDGMAFSQTQVALTMARIAAVPGLGAPVLSTSTAQSIGTRSLVSFSMDVPIDARAQGQPGAAAPGTAGTPSPISSPGAAR
jgi:Tfp pilus assembly protein PilN